MALYLNAQAQNHKQEVWAGYVNSIELNQHWSFWNDYHLVPESFALIRVGLTYQAKFGMRFTNGYAHVWTSSPNTNQLNRDEHRIWGQAVHNFKLLPRWRYSVRFRYDLRFRESLDENGNIMQSFYGLNYRWRFMQNLRFKFSKPVHGKFWHLDLMNEILFNSGKNIENGLDQLRNYLLVGYTRPKFTILMGYHQRIFPSNQASFIMNHGFTVWFIHRMKLKSSKMDPEIL
jgi:hypothetical protein